MQEKTFFMVKPDGVARNLAEVVFARVEAAGLTLLKKKRLLLTEEQAAELYQPHLGKPFYPGLLRFITSGPAIVGIVAGENAIDKLRELMGATDPRQAAAGTIRGDLKEDNIFTSDKIIKNIVHGSDSPESAQREMAIFF